ncbi:SAM-dependent methyltransferase [Halobacteriovorax sp.]|uniref:SAM-dependent methyltransferase n=1 Tax=Halobacteriovorax sp. TaxID=2020862 RepID=UPI003569F2F5
MKISENALLELLNEQDLTFCTSKFTPSQLAHLYVSSALLIEVMSFIKEQLWLQDKLDQDLDIKTTYEKFISPFFLNELKEIVFLQEFLIKSGSGNISNVLKNAKTIEKNILKLIKTRSKDDMKSFLIESLKEMKSHFLSEEKFKEAQDQSLGYQGLRLYRTFDRLDDIFNLNYSLDLNMDIDRVTKERLYQGSGVGVQSGYSTILLALHRIEAEVGSTVIDLGSGYGRVGLVCSLLRPDINFIGYEYVPHRVDISNIACKALGLDEKLDFKVQDLSLKSFKIPDADYYYLYDPFSEETYKYILDQIIEISTRKKVTIVTKGNARGWLSDIAKKYAWPKAVYIDESNLCIFSSL